MVIIMIKIITRLIIMTVTVNRKIIRTHKIMVEINVLQQIQWVKPLKMKTIQK